MIRIQFDGLNRQEVEDQMLDYLGINPGQLSEFTTELPVEPTIPTMKMEHVVADELEFSVRTFGVLIKAEITTMGELSRYGRGNFKTIKGCGRKTMRELDEMMIYLNLPWGNRVLVDD